MCVHKDSVHAYECVGGLCVCMVDGVCVCVCAYWDIP